MADNGRSELSLVVFTVLTQMAVGIFVIWGILVASQIPLNPFKSGLFPVIILSVALASLALGTLSAATHLGRPIGALFSLSNWRKSWLSREAILAAFFGLVLLIALILQLTSTGFDLLNRLVVYIGILTGLYLVWGISRLYQLRTVPAWNNLATLLTFFTTSLLTGLVAIRLIWTVPAVKETVIVGSMGDFAYTQLSQSLISLLVIIQAVIFILLMIYLNQLGGAGQESVRILWQRHRILLILRWLTAVLGILLLSGPAVYFLLLASELIGRYLFYAFYQRTGY